MKSQVSQFFRSKNPFREISTKSSPKCELSCRLMDTMNQFEETLGERMKNLIPESVMEVGSFKWMNSAMECLSAVHGDIENLMVSVDLPIAAWDEEWIQVYLDTSVKLLDLCIAFSSEIARLNQGNLFVQCAVHDLDRDVSKQMTRVRSSFASWSRSISSRNRRMEDCPFIIKSIVGTLDVPKVKTSAKGKVLMSGMYGMRVLSVFLCGVFGTILTGSAENMVELRVSDSYEWGGAYGDLQKAANGGLMKLMGERGGGLLKELQSVDDVMRRIGGDQTEWLHELKGRVDTLSEVLQMLENQINTIFKTVLAGRDALLSTFRSSTNLPPIIHIPNLKQQTVFLGSTFALS